MPIDNPDHWFLKKHDNGEIFGPVSFDKIEEWAKSAQVNPQDTISTDETVWTKAPMVPELKMDWLVVVGEDLLYGPTTSGALLEFNRIGEITGATELINCCSGTRTTLGETEFFQKAEAAPKEDVISVSPLLSQLQVPAKSNLRVSLQQRVLQLESALLDRRRRLMQAEETISRLENRIRELEERIRDFSGLRTS